MESRRSRLAAPAGSAPPGPCDSGADSGGDSPRGGGAQEGVSATSGGRFPLRTDAPGEARRPGAGGLRARGLLRGGQWQGLLESLGGRAGSRTEKPGGRRGFASGNRDDAGGQRAEGTEVAPGSCGAHGGGGRDEGAGREGRPPSASAWREFPLAFAVPTMGKHAERGASSVT